MADGSDRDSLQAAWRRLLSALERGDERFGETAGVDLDAHEAALGYRNLCHIFAFATGLYMNVDRDRPSFAPSLKDPPDERTLGEHPDVNYQWAAIRGGRRYRITGQRGDEAYLSFTVHRGTRGSGREQAFDSHLNHHDIKTDRDARFEIIVSPEPEGENWLRNSHDANEIYARAYHFDRLNERTATYTIDALDPSPVSPLTPSEVVERIQAMTNIVTDMTTTWPQPLTNPNTVGDLWQIDINSPSRMWTALDNAYNRGNFRISSGEALLLEGDVVPCDYWGVQVWTPFLGSGNYRRHRVALNTSQARLDSSGRFRVAIVTDDMDIPGVDCISTAGERQGTFFVRWMCPSRLPDASTCRLVKLSDLTG